MPRFSAEKPQNDRRASPSGRGVAVPAFSPGKYRQHYPILPIPFGISGAVGSPSTEFSVSASRFMQNATMNHDDVAYFASVDSNPPYDVDRTYSSDAPPLTSMGLDSGGGVQWALSMNNDDDDSDEKTMDVKELRMLIGMMLDEAREEELLIATDDEDSEEQDEGSGAGAVAGYTAPLGTTPKVPGTKRKRQPAWSVVGRAFGTAQLTK